MTGFFQLSKLSCFYVLFVVAILLPPMDLSFADTESAVKTMPDSFVCLEHDQTPSYAVIVDKKSQTLTLYSFNGSYKKELSLKCSTGEIPGPKFLSGDKKTPEGVYFFKEKFKKKYLSDVYGNLAFPMDYPNLIDRLQGKNGNSIWLHGTNKPLKPKDSNGCIVLANADISKLAEYITLNNTPIIVEENVNLVPTDENRKIKTEVLDFLLKWNAALEHGTYHEYLSFYDSKFVPDISWWPYWQATKNVFTKDNGDSLSARIERISVLKHNGIYVALFNQAISASGQIFPAGTKKLYIKPYLITDQKRLTIVGEIFQPDIIEKERTENPFLTACKSIKTTVMADEEIAELIDGWLDAWSSKDIKSYGNFYAADFFSDGMNLTSWLRKKRKLNSSYDFIKVTKKNLEIQKGKKYSTATFIQYYESSIFKAEGGKKLILKLEDGRWKIYREIWKKR